MFLVSRALPSCSSSLESLSSVGIDLETVKKKLVGMSTDGASVMLGKNNGVYAKLKELQPSLVAIHCMAHRLELSYKDGVKDLPLYNKLTLFMSNVYTFYKRSSLNKSMLKRSAASLDMNLRMPLRIGGTRWVQHLLNATTNLSCSYKAILQHCEQVNGS